MQPNSICGVCGLPLENSPEEVAVKCGICGKESKIRLICQNKHYVCPECSNLTIPQVLEKVIASSKSKSPMEILELVMAHPKLSMHGPDHHYIIPIVIVAAAKNAGYDVPVEAILQAMQRGQQVPGGWCGFCGACGAGVGVGIAAGALTMSTPVSGKKRSLAIDATSTALARMVDGAPRCCKKAGRIAMETAVDFLNEKIGTKLEKGKQPVCTYSARNKECVRQACKYYPV
jgi:hypothetical protein